MCSSLAGKVTLTFTVLVIYVAQRQRSRHVNKCPGKMDTISNFIMQRHPQELTTFCMVASCIDHVCICGVNLD